MVALKCLVFDCDGVILDSVPVKTRAFARLAEPYGPEARDKFVLYHAMHGGVSRYLKFGWFFREFLGREISPAESAEWGRKFESLALDEVRKCDLIPGALNTLKRWQGVLPMYVCSGAPQAEVALVLRERGLEQYFNGIFGSPPAKALLLREIIKKACVLPEETLMVGDATTDRDAAVENDAQFYGVGPDLKGALFPWSMNLEPLNSWIEEHLNNSA